MDYLAFVVGALFELSYLVFVFDIQDETPNAWQVCFLLITSKNELNSECILSCGDVL